jgi:hypothetical protein
MSCPGESGDVGPARHAKDFFERFKIIQSPSRSSPSSGQQQEGSDDRQTFAPVPNLVAARRPHPAPESLSRSGSLALTPTSSSAEQNPATRPIDTVFGPVEPPPVQQTLSGSEGTSQQPLAPFGPQTEIDQPEIGWFVRPTNLRKEDAKPESETIRITVNRGAFSAELDAVDALAIVGDGSHGIPFWGDAANLLAVCRNKELTIDRTGKISGCATMDWYETRTAIGIRLVSVQFLATDHVRMYWADLKDITHIDRTALNPRPNDPH